MDRARIPIEELITCFKSTSTVGDIFEKLEGWNRNDVQNEHSKDYTLQKLLLHSENPIELKEKAQSINHKLLDKFMELIQEVSEDKKLTTFLEKRTKEYEKEMSCSESAQHYKNEVEKRNEFQKQRQIKKETRDKKLVLKKSICNQIALWKNIRKYQALDFFNLPISSSSMIISPEECDLVDDILSCLQGFHGKFITPNKLNIPLTFNIHSSIDPQYKCLVPKILRLASAYTIICRYCEENRQSHNGYVNQALACYISKFIRDYLNFIICLENQHKFGKLNIQSLSFAAQAHVYKMEFVARIVSTIMQENKKGGQSLSILHEEVIQCYIDDSLKKLLGGMVEVSTIPFFQSLEKWIFKGQVFDPCDEFMIKCGNLVLSDDTEKYWNRCYTVRNEYVPSYLEKFKEIILRTGKYLNALYHCNIPDKSNLVYKSTSDEKLIYSLWCSDATNYLKTINSAYMFASNSLLNVLLIDYDLINRLKSIKRYFLLEQGDFVVHLLYVCDEELKKPTDDIVYNRLESLLDICLRVNVGCVDQYKDDIKMELKKDPLSFQIFKILAIQTEKEKDYTAFQPASNLLGIQSFCLGLKTQWPVSLIFNETVISNYQMLFRLLLLCKSVERQLLKIWLYDKQLKKVPNTYYNEAFNLRQNMLLFVQNLEYYMFEEVIETQWQTFTSAIQFKVKNVDELLDEQQKFLNLCLKNCMVTNPDLMKRCRYLLELCAEFSDYILELPKNDLNLNIDFQKQIQILENKFTAAMIDLLKCIRKMSQLDSGNIIYNFLYRMDFNGMYTEQINMDDTVLYT